MTDDTEETCPYCKQGIPRKQIVVIGGGPTGMLAISAALLAKLEAVVTITSVDMAEAQAERKISELIQYGETFTAPPPYTKLKKIAPYGKKAKRGGYRGY